MRKVKLVDTNEYSTSDVAYKAPNGKYFSNEAAYIKWLTNKEFREKCIAKIYDILHYETFMKVPGYFYKWLLTCEGYGYEVAYRCMCDSEDTIQWALKNKNFSSESGKIMYLCKVWDNHMNDALKDVVREKKNIEAAHRSKELETHQTYIDEFPVGNAKLKQKGTNITSLLGDLD